MTSSLTLGLVVFVHSYASFNVFCLLTPTSPANVTAKLGSHVNFCCHTDSPLEIRWTFHRSTSGIPTTLANGNRTSTRLASRYSVLALRGLSQLRISEVERNDSGKYVCQEITADDPGGIYFELTVSDYDEDAAWYRDWWHHYALIGCSLVLVCLLLAVVLKKKKSDQLLGDGDDNGYEETTEVQIQIKFITSGALISETEDRQTSECQDVRQNADTREFQQPPPAYQQLDQQRE